MISDNDDIDLENVISELGAFGKFQQIIYILTFLPIILDSCLCLSYVFTTSQLEYRFVSYSYKYSNLQYIFRIRIFCFVRRI